LNPEGTDADEPVSCDADGPLPCCLCVALVACSGHGGPTANRAGLVGHANEIPSSSRARAFLISSLSQSACVCEIESNSVTHKFERHTPRMPTTPPPSTRPRVGRGLARPPTPRPPSTANRDALLRPPPHLAPAPPPPHPRTPRRAAPRPTPASSPSTDPHAAHNEPRRATLRRASTAGTPCVQTWLVDTCNQTPLGP
jgi:hypothetical protein